jgi:hypothetical protein
MNRVDRSEDMRMPKLSMDSLTLPKFSRPSWQTSVIIFLCLFMSFSFWYNRAIYHKLYDWQFDHSVRLGNIEDWIQKGEYNGKEGDPMEQLKRRVEKLEGKERL